MNIYITCRLPGSVADLHAGSQMLPELWSTLSIICMMLGSLMLPCPVYKKHDRAVGQAIVNNSCSMLQALESGVLLHGGHREQPLQIFQGPLMQQRIGLTEPGCAQQSYTEQLRST